MSDITNAGGEPDGKNPVTETSTGETPQSKKVEVNSTDSVGGTEAEPAPPSPEPRRTRRGKAKQTGEATEEAAQSPVGGGGKPSPRAKGAKAKREAVKAAGTLAEKKAKKASPEQFVATLDQKRELDSIVPELKAFMRNDVETRLKLGDALIRAGAILPRGHLEVYATEHTGLVPRYIRQIKKASEEFRDHRRQLVYASGLGFTCVLALSLATEAVQDDVLQKAADGKRYRVADIKSAIEAAKPKEVKDAEAAEKAKPKPERPGLAGLRVEIARYVPDQAGILFEELKAIRKAVDTALNDHREGRSVKKAELFKSVRAPALHALVLQRELMGRKTRMDFPNHHHAVKYGDWAENSRWGGVAKALLTLVELDRNKKGSTFAHDLEFDVLEPLTWAISSTAAAGEADIASEVGDEPSGPANDDDQADEAA